MEDLDEYEEKNGRILLTADSTYNNILHTTKKN
ncbi:hypothetical protein T4D_12587 [Trichinella pseudospiralis]|uniref:Uncharacterized protein n=1 Tax=Trichinella pseudospiralis TaxID=6337 RepID=A0A0V1F5Z1_TRIPS|nr:hypothetical protein T4D_12587 [Trichinella pseudospiralis]